jgi:hypothetical protein
MSDRKAQVNVERTLNLLAAQIDTARKEIAAGGKTSKEGEEFHTALQQISTSKAWAALCW